MEKRTTSTTSSSMKDKAKSRRKFSSAEDEILLKLIEVNGPHRWDIIAENLPYRSGRQCRDRYMNYLMTNLKNGPWKQEEDELLEQKFLEFGTHWSLITKFFKGRSANNLKNRWYTYHQKKDSSKSQSKPKSHSQPQSQPQTQPQSPLISASSSAIGNPIFWNYNAENTLNGCKIVTANLKAQPVYLTTEQTSLSSMVSSPITSEYEPQRKLKNVMLKVSDFRHVCLPIADTQMTISNERQVKVLPSLGFQFPSNFEYSIPNFIN